MPTFCRHGRMLANCPICSKADAPAKPARAPRAVRTRSAGPRSPRGASGVRVRHVERAADDGYDNELAPGLRATADAARLADELAFSATRLEELAADPPGAYAEAARAEPGAGAELLFAIAAGENDAGLTAFRVWADRAGGPIAALTGEPDWDPTRRFARIFERLTMPGLGRRRRYEFLVTVGALGLVPLEAGTLAVGSDTTDPVVLAAKRVTGIGDAITIERRLGDLARGTGVPLAALDLALYNWSRTPEERETMDSRPAADAARRKRIAAALGV